MKSIFASKTFWLAVIQAAGGLILVLETQYPGAGWIVIGKSIVDIINRYMTVAPVKIM